MTTVLYADVLFLIDFSMDFISLYITGRVTHERMKTLRIAGASVIGGVVSVFAVAAEPGRGVRIALEVICPFIMEAVAFRCRREKIITVIKRVTLIWVSETLLGGAVTMVMTFGDGIKPIPVTAERNNISPYIIGAVLAIAGVLLIIKHREKRGVEVEIKILESKEKLKLLSDSGNLLREPFSGMPVIILSKKSMARLIGQSDTELICAGIYDGFLKHRFRVIPAEGITGEKILIGLKPEEVKIDGKSKNAVVALSDKSDFGEYDGIVPGCLL